MTGDFVDTLPTKAALLGRIVIPDLLAVAMLTLFWSVQ